MAKQKNQNGAGASVQGDMQRQQRKLIPVNIVVMVLALVAGFTLIFAPLIEIDFGQIMTALADTFMSEEDDNANDGQNNGYNDDMNVDGEGDQVGEGENDGQLEGMEGDFMKEILDSLGGLKFSLSTYTVAKFAFSTDIMDVIVEKISNIMSEATDKVLVNVAVPLIMAELEDSAPEEISEKMESVDRDKVFEAFNDLENATPATKEAKINDLINVLSDEFDQDFSAEDRESLSNAIGELYDNTAEKNDGKFSVEACICISVSEMLSDGEENATVYTSYEEISRELLQQFTGDGEGEGDSNFGSVLDMITEFTQYIAYVLLFFACIWFLLFLFAFIHTFLKNKRFMMWYVKLFGPYPCIIFWLLPVLAKNVLASALGDGGEIVEAIFGAISSTAWISGLCYLLLWAVSIFWAFPIKRKIRKLKKEGR